MDAIEQSGFEYDCEDFRKRYFDILFDEVELRGQNAIMYFGDDLPDLSSMPKILDPYDLDKRNFFNIRSLLRALKSSGAGVQKSYVTEVVSLASDLKGLSPPEEDITSEIEWLYHTLCLICYTVTQDGSNINSLPLSCPRGIGELGVKFFWEKFLFCNSCLNYEGTEVNRELEDLLFSAGAREISWDLLYANPSLRVGGVSDVTDFMRKLGKYGEHLSPYLVFESVS